MAYNLKSSLGNDEYHFSIDPDITYACTSTGSDKVDTIGLEDSTHIVESQVKPDGKVGLELNSIPASEGSGILSMVLTNTLANILAG